MMAIDMVTLSLKRLVGVVVIITGDGDLVPALKLARVEGLRVILVKPRGDVQIAKELFVHADLVIERGAFRLHLVSGFRARPIQARD